MRIFRFVAKMFDDWSEKLVVVIMSTGLETGLAIWGIVIKAIVSIFAAIPACFLWNWLMPEIFGIKTLTLFQTWGIVFLARILF